MFLAITRKTTPLCKSAFATDSVLLLLIAFASELQTDRKKGKWRVLKQTKKQRRYSEKALRPEIPSVYFCLPCPL